MISREKGRAYARKFRDMQVQLQGMLAEGRKNNEEYEETLRKKEIVDKALTDAQDLKQKTKILLAKAQQEDRDFTNRRIDHMSDTITEFVGEIFPYDGYKATVVCDPNRKFKAHLKLVGKDGNTRLTHMSEGKFNQSLISFGGCVSTSESLGASKFYLDEPFAVSDQDNLKKVSKFYLSLINKGMQIIMIEQNPIGYKDLPRREIHLTRDPISNETHLSNIVDI